MTEAVFAAGTLKLVQGDITKQRTEAMVTAANAGLHGGGGVDGAIHRAAGSRLYDACRKIGGCATGSAVATPAFDLEAQGVRRVIHAVGPIYRFGKGGYDEAALLMGAYRTSLEVAAAEGCVSVAFPAISTGVYRYPTQEAATLALQVVKEFFEGEAGPVEEVVFVLFDRQTFDIFSETLEAVSRTAG